MDDVLKELDPTGARTRVFTVWEKVMRSDGEPPIAATLARISHPQAVQFWDPERAISKQAYGEIDEGAAGRGEEPEHVLRVVVLEDDGGAVAGLELLGKEERA